MQLIYYPFPVISAYGCFEVTATDIPINDTGDVDSRPLRQCVSVTMRQSGGVLIQPQSYILVDGHRIEFADAPTQVPYAVQCYPASPPLGFQLLMANDVAACLQYLYPEATVTVQEDSGGANTDYIVSMCRLVCGEDDTVSISGGFEPNQMPTDARLETGAYQSSEISNNSATVEFTVGSTDGCSFSDVCSSVRRFAHIGTPDQCGCENALTVTARIKPMRAFVGLMRSAFPTISDLSYTQLLHLKKEMTRAFFVRAVASGNNVWTQQQSNPVLVTPIFTAVNARLTPEVVANTNSAGLGIFTNETLYNANGDPLVQPNYPLNITPFWTERCPDELVFAQWLVQRFNYPDYYATLNLLVDGIPLTYTMTAGDLGICHLDSYNYRVLEANIGLQQITPLLISNGINPATVGSVTAWIESCDNNSDLLFATTPYTYTVERSACCCEGALHFLFLSNLGSWETVTARAYSDTVMSMEYQTFERCACFEGAPSAEWQTATVKQSSTLSETFRARFDVGDIEDENLFDKNSVFREFVNAKAVYLYRKTPRDLTKPAAASWLFYPCLISEAEAVGGRLNFTYSLFNRQSLNQ